MRSFTSVYVVTLVGMYKYYIIWNADRRMNVWKSIIIFHHSFSYRFFFIHRKISNALVSCVESAGASERRAPSSPPKYCVVRFLGGITRYRIFSYFLVAPPTFMRVFPAATRTLLETLNPYDSYFLFIFSIYLLSSRRWRGSFSAEKFEWAEKRIYVVDEGFQRHRPQKSFFRLLYTKYLASPANSTESNSQTVESLGQNNES